MRQIFAILLISSSVIPASAQVANPELETCRSTGLIALRERNPAIKDLTLDTDGLTVAKANTRVEDTPIKTKLSETPISKKTKKTPAELSSASLAKKGRSC